MDSHALAPFSFGNQHSIHQSNCGAEHEFLARLCVAHTCTVRLFPITSILEHLEKLPPPSVKGRYLLQSHFVLFISCASFSCAIHCSSSIRSYTSTILFIHCHDLRAVLVYQHCTCLSLMALCRKTFSHAQGQTIAMAIIPARINIGPLRSAWVSSLPRHERLFPVYLRHSIHRNRYNPVLIFV